MGVAGLDVVIQIIQTSLNNCYVQYCVAFINIRVYKIIEMPNPDFPKNSQVIGKHDSPDREHFVWDQEG